MPQKRISFTESEASAVHRVLSYLWNNKARFMDVISEDDLHAITTADIKIKGAVQRMAADAGKTPEI